MLIAELLVRIGVDIDDAKKAEQRVHDLRKATDRLATEGKRDVGTLGRAFNAVGRDVRGAAGEIGGLVNRMGGLRTVAIAGAAAFAGAAVGIFQFVRSNAEAVGSLKDLAASTGVEVEELQRLKFAASQSGVEADQLGVALKTLNKNLLDAKTGGGEAFQKSLGEIGLQLKDLDGLSRTQQIGLIGDRLNLIADAGERSARAADIFGMRAGPALASLLAEGSAGIDKLAASTAGVFTAEQVAAAEEFGDELAAVQGQVQAVAREVAIELLPVVRDGVLAFGEWIRENDQLIQQDLPAVMRTIADAMRDVGSATASVIEWTSKLSDSYDGLSAVLDVTTPGFNQFVTAVSSSILPLQGAANIVNDLYVAMVKLNFISAKMKGGAAAGLAEQVLAGAERAAAEAAKNRPVRTGTTTTVNVGREKPQAGGGGGGRSRSEDIDIETISPIGAAISSLRDRGGDVIASKFQSLLPHYERAGGGSRDMRPQVVQTINNNTTNIGTLNQEINSNATDPKIVAGAAVAALRKETSAARQGLDLTSL